MHTGQERVLLTLKKEPLKKIYETPFRSQIFDPFRIVKRIYLNVSTVIVPINGSRYLPGMTVMHRVCALLCFVSLLFTATPVYQVVTVQIYTFPLRFTLFMLIKPIV